MTNQEQALRGFLEHAWRAGYNYEGIRARPGEVKGFMERYLNSVDLQSALTSLQLQPNTLAVGTSEEPV